jgi:3-oxoadipate enol-lactonase
MTATPIAVEVPAGRLQGERAGAGPAVVLLHGFSFDRSMWDPQFDALARRYLTVRYDLRGFGQSGPPVAGRGHVGDLLGVLDALQIERAHLVGLSLGANIALAAAVLHPDRVGGVVLASPGLPGYRWSTPRPPDQAADVARGEGVAAAKRYWLGHEIFRSAARYPDARERLSQMVGRFPAYQWGDGPATDPLPTLADRLGSVRAPVLVLNGALDVPGYREIAAVLEQSIASAQRAEFADAGHLLSLERPADFNRWLLRFLAETEAESEAESEAGTETEAETETEDDQPTGTRP